MPESINSCPHKEEGLGTGASCLDNGRLIDLVSQEIDRDAEKKERHRGFYDVSHFYRLVNISSKMLGILLVEEPASSCSDEECQDFLRDKE